ncbi:MAG: hypothetical protein COA44_07455 [Arcobacter sp.]|nr:MAG: hypothetical protein COA44_07455 [Arcobacter sp.]
MSKAAKYFHKSLFSLLLLSLASSLLGAKDTSTCYSVQLASIYNKNSIYLKIEDYPSECKLISLANLKAIRCGCFEDKKEAQNSLKQRRKKYHGSILVRTYKSRFIEAKTILTQEKKSFKEKDIEDTQEEAQDLEAEEELLQQSPNWIQSLLTNEDISIQGNLNLTTQTYPSRPDDKHKYNLTGSGEVEFSYTKDDVSFVAKVYAQGDSYDMQGSSDKNHRSFLRLDELYIKQDFEDDQIQLGKSIQFWGSLEARNITDVFNPDDMRSDIFNSQKLGVWNGSYTHYTETGELSIIIKLHEPDIKMAGLPYVYYFFPAQLPDTQGGTLPLSYDDKLELELAQRPSFYIKYTGSTDSQYALDYAIIFENGYDSQRYYTYTPNSSTSPTSISVQQNAYAVNKLMTYNTLVLGSTLLKFEGVYTDIISTDDILLATGKKKDLSDYYHLGLGLEHTLTQVYEGSDLGLIAEYYKYGTLEDGDVFTDLDLFQVFQNDLFIGARYSFNQGNDASIIAGVIYDLDYDEEVYSFVYESRIYESFKLKFDYYYINPSDDTLTAYNLMGKHQRLSLKAGYYF